MESSIYVDLQVHIKHIILFMAALGHTVAGKKNYVYIPFRCSETDRFYNEQEKQTLIFRFRSVLLLLKLLPILENWPAHTIVRSWCL